MKALAGRQNALASLARLLPYAAIVAAPLALAALGDGEPHDRYAAYLGESVALTAFVILALQFVLAARLRWIEAPFGLDRLVTFHRVMAVAAAALLVSHPILLAPGPRWHFLTSLDYPWYVLLGRATLAVIAVNIAAALGRAALRLKYEPWTALHSALGCLALAGGFLHSWLAGPDLNPWPMRSLWIALAAAAAAGYAWNRVLRPLRLRRRAWTVTEVRQETPAAWVLRLAPPKGERVPEYLPGQFHFLTLYRGRGLPVEEHPFSISSSPAQEGFLASTIKEAGDFTATIGLTRPGDRCAVLGPFGRFSYVLHPGEKDLVFIAGGIGITPLAAMLQHMRDIQAPRSVLLFCANGRESDIAFRKELDEAASGERPHVTVVHVLSHPGNAWAGERGHVDEALLRRRLGAGAAGKAYYLCGPLPMIEMARRALRRIGVPASRIHFEVFRL